MTRLATFEDVEKFGLAVDIIQMRYTRWLQTVVTRIVDEEIVQPIKESMRQYGYSQKIIDGTDIDLISLRGKQVTVKIKSEYFAEQPDGTFFDVAVAREEGTKDHWIEPKESPTITAELSGAFVKKKALHWKTPYGENVFSKGHEVSGIEARHVVKRGIEQGKAKTIERIKQEFEDWKNEILKT